jgi:hypothetical protein
MCIYPIPSSPSASMRQNYSPIHLIESNTVNFDTHLQHPKKSYWLIQRTFVKKKSIIVARFRVIPLVDDSQCGYITKLQKIKKSLIFLKIFGVFILLWMYIQWAPHREFLKSLSTWEEFQRENEQMGGSADKNLSILFSGASRFMTTCIFEDRFFGLHTHFCRNKERTSKVTLSPAGYLLADHKIGSCSFCSLHWDLSNNSKITLFEDVLIPQMTF